MGVWSVVFSQRTIMRTTLFSTIITFIFVSTVVTVHALTVSPAKIEITADPGQTVRGEVELFNEQSETRTFYTSYENFESRGDSGAPYFTGSKSGLATWMSAASEVTLAPGERIQVPYSIATPISAKPGGYFAALFFGSQPSRGTEGGEVTIGGKIGVLILLRVAGEVEESAGLVDFGAKDGTRVFSSLPLTLEYGFNNTGGDRVVPRGEIKIKNTIRLTSATLLANDHEGSVLPGSTRRFEVVWGDEKIEHKGFFSIVLAQLTDFHFGWYTARMELTWGESAQTASAAYNFFVIPWQLLSIVLGIAALVWFVFKFWMARFKRRILAEAMRQK
jgi:hypothetical protein